MRAGQNNPILTGEAASARPPSSKASRSDRIGRCAAAAQDVTLRSLDVGLLQAGASMKGEFEQRLRQVIEEVQASPKPIIMFIDEAHTLVGAGGAAAPATPPTCSSPRSRAARCAPSRRRRGPRYKKHIEKDPALTRRFQVVQVHEPSEEKAILMMRGAHLDDGEAPQGAGARRGARGLGAARRIATSRRGRCRTSREPARYRCARVAISQHAVPPRGRRHAQAHRGARERARDHRRETRSASRRRSRAAPRGQARREKTKLKDSRTAGTREKALVDKILDIRGKLRAGSGKVEGTASALEAAADAAAKAARGPDAALQRARNRERKVLLEQLRSCRDSCTSCRATAR
jgi:type VI secretion system protein VasG